jgi:ribokinase
MKCKEIKMSKPAIIVIGSSNMDLVAKAPRIPVTGETLTGLDFFMTPGGKGANQAVAAAKLGGNVIFIARLGSDVFAQQSLDNFNSAGIQTRLIKKLPGVPSGVALIAINESGSNSIIVVPGANHKLLPADILEAQGEIASAKVVVAQLEIPIETVIASAKIAKQYNVPFILDPAPAKPLPDELLKMVDVIKPNEIEAQGLTGIQVVDENSAYNAASVLLQKGVKNVIITLGHRGFIVSTAGKNNFFPSIKVNAVDSTAAGDAFTGALAFGLANGKTLSDAAVFANKVAAFSVTRLGAQASMPTFDEVVKAFGN